MTIWVAAVALLLLVHVTYQYSDESVCPAPERKSAVAIYAGRAFHEEVTASLACAYFSLGHNVTLYIDDTIRIMDIPLPFASGRIADSARYYGRCVQTWVSTSGAVQLSNDTEVLIMTTYPMKVNRRTSDETAYRLIQQIGERRVQTQLLLVTHRAKSGYWKHLDRITQFVPPSRIAFVFLAEHVHHIAETLRSGRTGQFPRVAYMHPVVPLDLLFDRNYRPEFTDVVSQRHNDSMRTASTGTHVLTYAIQGHFGGRHSKRRNVQSAAFCLRSAVTEGSQLQLRLVGRGAAAADAGPPHRNVRVTRHADLDSPTFYFEVAKATYLLTAIGPGSNSNGISSTSSSSSSSSSRTSSSSSSSSSTSSTSSTYEKEKATSSVALALTLGMPLVSTRSLLGLYPCLRDSAAVMALAGETDCDSVQRAQRQTAAEYNAVRREMRRCASELWQQTLGTLAGLMNSLASGNGTHAVNEDFSGH